MYLTESLILDHHPTLQDSKGCIVGRETLRLDAERPGLVQEGISVTSKDIGDPVLIEFQT